MDDITKRMLIIVALFVVLFMGTQFSAHESVNKITQQCTNNGGHIRESDGTTTMMVSDTRYEITVPVNKCVDANGASIPIKL